MMSHDIDLDIERASQKFSRIQKFLGVTFAAILAAALVATVGILTYLHKRAAQAEEAAKKAVQTSEAAFEQASDQVAMLDDAAKANDKIKGWAKQISQTGTTVQKRDAQRIISDADTVAAKLEETISSSKTTQLAQDEVIQDVSARTTGPGRYGVVVSADRQEIHTVEAVEQLQRRGFHNIAIYSGHGPLRTVVRFDAWQDARDELSRVQQYRSTAYLINLDKWCINPQDTGKRIANAAVYSCE
jgi:multidrug efflux pump subunit AcrB